MIGKHSQWSFRGIRILNLLPLLSASNSNSLGWHIVLHLLIVSLLILLSHLVKSFLLLIQHSLPSFSAFSREFSKDNCLLRMLFFMLFATGLHEECIRCHTAPRFCVSLITAWFCGWLTLYYVLIVLIVCLMILLDLMILDVLILKKNGNRNK